MNNIVTLKKLTKSFDNFIAVDNISLDIKKGTIFGLLGPNGAGKSTTIRMIIGVLQPTTGTAIVNGIDVIKNPESIKKEIGYMSQKFGLYEDLTVIENLQFYASIYGIKGNKKTERIKQLIEMANLTEKEKTLVKHLSGGWKQRLALSCSLIHKPKILILDEPTAGVDPVSRRIFWKIIFELATQNISIIVTTHYMDEAESCDEVAFIFDGKILVKDTPSNLIKDENAHNLEDVFIKYVEKQTGEKVSTSFHKLKFLQAGDANGY
ncbi:MAG: ABC transporter ATP-binding protein [Bacillota bacterium]|nr:ABC transporter ATP-binding protein [Bacillota bacterium]